MPADFLLFLFKTIFIILIMYVSVHVFVWVCASEFRGLWRSEESGSPESVTGGVGY